MTALVVLALFLVAGGAYLVVRARRRRPREIEAPAATRREPPDPYAGTSTEQLNYQASTALLDLDERVRTAQVNADYARSYFGDEAV
ncbi:MAG: TPM domain-containing protein, partial [Geodermatophilales bacterium]|nr:TPM domain-containing protein [Geodermatophilales bacterium]